MAFELRRWLRHPMFAGLAFARVAKFALVGFSGVFVNLGCLYVLADVLHVGDRVGSAIAIELSILWNFALNNVFTFADRNKTARAGTLERLVRYNAIGLVGLVIQLATFVVLNGVFMRLFHLATPGVWKYPSQCVGIGVAMVWNFVSNFFWTWGQQKPDAVASQGETRG